MADTFQFEVIAPERLFYQDEAEMVELRTSEGEVGILPKHIPMTAVVEPGILRIKKGDEIKEATLMDGFIEILPDKVVILAESCEWPEEIDANRADEARIRAERRIANGGDDINLTRAEMALRRSLIRLQLADKTK